MSAEEVCRCGRCHSCGVRRAHRQGKYRGTSAKMRLAWAEGRFASRAVPVRSNAWMAEEDAFLRAHVGTMPFDELVAAMAAETKIDRTRAAVAKHLHDDLGLSRWVDCWQGEHLERLFGVWARTVSRWIADGLLVGRRWNGRGPHPQWWVDDADVRAFIKMHPWAYDWRRMPVGQLRSLAEVSWRTDRWYTLKEAGKLTGLPYWKLKVMARDGRIATKRRFYREHMLSAASVTELRRAQG